MEHAGRLALAILAVEMGVDKRVIVHVFIPLSCPDQMGRRLMDIGAQQPLEGYMYLSKKAQGTSHNSSGRVAIHECLIVANDPARIVCDRYRQLLAIM
jgi:hypothetical protein